MGRVPSRGSDQFVVRFPDGMRDRIAEAAKAAGRSMNAEIVHRLERSFTFEPVGDDLADTVGVLHALAEQLTNLTRALQPERDIPMPPETEGSGLVGTRLGRLRPKKP